MILESFDQVRKSEWNIESLTAIPKRRKKEREHFASKNISQ